MNKIVNVDHNTHDFAHNVISVMSDFIVFMGEIDGVAHNSVDVMRNYVDFMGDYSSVMGDFNSVMGDNGDFAQNAVIITHTYTDFDRNFDESMDEIQGDSCVILALNFPDEVTNQRRG